MNKTFISGNLGQDALVKSTEDGRQYLQFSVAVNEGKNADGSTRTTWFNCSDWNESRIKSSLKDFLKSGTKVLLVGRYVPQIWQRTVDGVLQAPEISHGFLVNELELCGGGGQGNSFAVQPVAQPVTYQSNQQAQPAQAFPNPATHLQQPIQPSVENVGDDDLPF